MVNRFGDVFAVFEDESVNMLDVGRGALTRVADNREHFATKVDEDDNGNEWFMVELVDKCVAAGLTLNGNQCYGFTTPPIFREGRYEVDNLHAISIAEHYSFLADLHHQIDGLPDGSKVKVVVSNIPKREDGVL
jgi:hypothetical protein